MIRALAFKKSQSPEAVEALVLLQTLTELSSEATGAVESNDGESLLRILAERARIMERTEELLAQVRLDTSESSGNSAGKAALLNAARELATLDAALRAAIVDRRDALGRDLNALESGGAARSAYGGRQRGRDTINVVR